MGNCLVRELGGLVKMVVMFECVVELGFVSFLFFMMMVLINLGFINLLLILMFDGGYFVFYVVEVVWWKLVGLVI